MAYPQTQGIRVPSIVDPYRKLETGLYYLEQGIHTEAWEVVREAYVELQEAERRLKTLWQQLDMQGYILVFDFDQDQWVFKTQGAR